MKEDLDHLRHQGSVHPARGRSGVLSAAGIIQERAGKVLRKVPCALEGLGRTAHRQTAPDLLAK